MKPPRRPRTVRTRGSRLPVAVPTSIVPTARFGLFGSYFAPWRGPPEDSGHEPGDGRWRRQDAGADGGWGQSPRGESRPECGESAESTESGCAGRGARAAVSRTVARASTKSQYAKSRNVTPQLRAKTENAKRGTSDRGNRYMSCALIHTGTVAILITVWLGARTATTKLQGGLGARGLDNVNETLGGLPRASTAGRDIKIKPTPRRGSRN
eukprot:5202994-Prymnesium_polylepis.1